MTSATRSRGWAVRMALVLGLTLIAATAVAPAASEPQVAVRSLGFQVTLRQSGPFTLPCRPEGVSDPSIATACLPFTGTESVRGLGNVSATHTELYEVGQPACPGDFTKSVESTGRLGVAGKGEIFLTFAGGTRCEERWWHHEPLEFTITGGTGRFAGASGKGTREHWIGPPSPAEEIWTATLDVPGLAFDMTPPILTLHGAASKTARARKGATSARVTFNVSAIDGVDSALPVSCQPGSGSRFTIGRAAVRCKATDSSGNTARVAFTVTVTRRR